ncbi:hypothetical protein QWA68_016935, partial [Fusarium oxysporum]
KRSPANSESYNYTNYYRTSSCCGRRKSPKTPSTQRSIRRLDRTRPARGVIREVYHGLLSPISARGMPRVPSTLGLHQ